MDKSYRSLIERRFLIESLPEPLTRASSHIQLFDNYIPNTRIRLRSVRTPETKEWTHILQQCIRTCETVPAEFKVAELYLNEAEYAQFQIFEGEEIRKNRYFHEFDGVSFSFDVYLGDLWGLNVAVAEYESADAARASAPPSFAVFEVSSDPFFDGFSLVGKKFSDVQEAASRLSSLQTRSFAGEL